MTNYPLLDAFLTMMWFFLWILWIFLLIRIFMDIFRSDDLGGWGKAGWSIFIIILPFLGVLVYLIARGKGMAQRDNRDIQAANQAFDERVRQVAAANGSSQGSTAEELSKLAELRSSGVLTDAEFNAQKAKILAS
jgi:hypothetical protein